MPDEEKNDSVFDRARKEIEGSPPNHAHEGDAAQPAAGPHAKKDETNEEATPGAGSLPSVDPKDEVETGTG